LIQYKNDTGSIKNDDFVFLCNGNNNRGNPLTYRAVENLLDNIVKATGIKKPVSPHLFRASRITNMIKEDYKESIIKKMMWQKLSTPMFDVYVKLADTDVQNEVKAHNGINDKIKTEAKTKPIKCVCGHINEPTANYCSNCARSLKDGVNPYARR
jgi:site-specific recombinase XerD